jgi:hypothetical protein
MSVPYNHGVVDVDGHRAQVGKPRGVTWYTVGFAGS